MADYVYDRNQTTQPVPEGDYEVIIERIDRRVAPTSGREKLAIQFRIRSDVEQPQKNRVLFDDVWTEKDNPEFFNRKKINQLLGTQKDLEDGTKFDTVNDVVQYLIGRELIAHVKVKFDDYRGMDVNGIAYYKPSKATPKAIKVEDPKPVDPTEAEEDDIPF